jgi:predicted metal-binding membrane protein
MVLSTLPETAAAPRYSVLRRSDILAISLALFSVVGLAWLYLVTLTWNMSGEGSSMASMSQIEPWTPLDFLLMFVMWAVMMIGMMVPTASRAVLIYAAVARQAATRGKPLSGTGWFVAGYVLVWTMFSLGATALQAGFNHLGLLSPMMASASPWFGATLLLVAGIYQFTPWKDTCLKHCQSPAQYLAGRFRSGVRGALNLGAWHGGYCLGCCWALMGLLFVGGVMNLLWIAVITIFVLLEKLLPSSWRVNNVAGCLMIAGAAVYLTVLLEH